MPEQAAGRGYLTQVAKATMLVTAAAQAEQRDTGELRPMDPARDLGELDERGREILREMRWLSRLSPLVWWLSQADPSFRDAFNGFVWHVPAARGRGRQVVANVSLNRAPGNRRWYIICNVAVEKAYQGRGIGRRLTEKAVSEAMDLGARGAVLQVDQGNLPAQRLYADLGFRDAASEIDLRLEAPTPVAVLDAAGYEVRAWRGADGPAAYQLAQEVIPEVLQWLKPLKADDYRPGWWLRLAQGLSDLMAGRRVYRLVALREERLVGLVTIAAAFRRGEHQLAILADPDQIERIVPPLVSRALHMLDGIPPRPVRITLDDGQVAALQVLQGYGFREQRTLLTWKKEFSR
jgi:GNAT superfamily N-acetyltransferase